MCRWIGYGSLHAPDTSQFQWRFPLAFQAFPAAILLVGMTFLPECPRYLIETGRYDKAMDVLRKLHFDGTNGEWIHAEYNEIKTTIEAENAVAASGWLTMFRVPQWRTRLLYASLTRPFRKLMAPSHGVAVQVFTQMTGINVIGYYQTILYNALQITGNRNTLIVGIYNCVGPLTNLIFIVFLLDKVGRRKPMIFGTVGISVALICEAALSSVNPTGEKTGYSIAGVFFIFCITIIFSLSFGPCSWLVSRFGLISLSITEGPGFIWPRSCRCRFEARATRSQRVSGTGRLAHYGIKSPRSLLGGSNGNTILCSFCGVSSLRTVIETILTLCLDILVSLPVIHLFFKETTQKTLEEIDQLFGGSTLDILPKDTRKMGPDILRVDEGKEEDTGISVENVEGVK